MIAVDGMFEWLNHICIYNIYICIYLRYIVFVDPQESNYKAVGKGRCFTQTMISCQYFLLRLCFFLALMRVKLMGKIKVSQTLPFLLPLCAKLRFLVALLRHPGGNGPIISAAHPNSWRKEFLTCRCLFKALSSGQRFP